MAETVAEMEAEMEAEAQPRLGWHWFAAWMLVGGLYAFSLVAIFSVGLFMLPIPVVATVLLARTVKARHGAFGLVAGIALPLFFISLLNRDGPGMICSAIDGGTSCTQEMSPWPWFAAGLIFLAVGTTAFWLSRPRSRVVGGEFHSID